MLRFNIFLESQKTQILGRKISPAFVEPEFFHRYSWLQPQSSNDSWYYSSPSPGIVKFPTNSQFYKTLDRGLHLAVRHLHQCGYPTTPSCTGHFYGPEVYEDLWIGIDETCQQIRKSGMCFVDPETGMEYECHDPNFKSPFSKTQYVNQALRQGHKGVLGMFDPSSKIYQHLERAEIPSSRIKKDGPLTLFLTMPGTEIELDSIWENFTDCILEI